MHEYVGRSSRLFVGRRYGTSRILCCCTTGIILNKERSSASILFQMQARVARSVEFVLESNFWLCTFHARRHCVCENARSCIASSRLLQHFLVVHRSSPSIKSFYANGRNRPMPRWEPHRKKRYKSRSSSVIISKTIEIIIPSKFNHVYRRLQRCVTRIIFCSIALVED